MDITASPHDIPLAEARGALCLQVVPGSAGGGEEGPQRTSPFVSPGEGTKVTETVEPGLLRADPTPRRQT